MASIEELRDEVIPAMKSVDELEAIARRCRVDAIKALREAQSGHPGSSMSLMDVMVALYHGDLIRHDPSRPDWPDRDLVLLSVGHAVPGLYSCLAHAGYAPVSRLSGLRQFGTGLEGHAKRGTFPGVECSAGSLGQGLGIGVGLALAARLQSRDSRVVVLMSDGEQEEGSVWEAAMSATKWELDNLVAVVDKNGNQINGPTSVVMPTLDPIAAKYQASHWQTREINGNDMAEVVAGLKWAFETENPSVLISHTETGFPISYMMGDYHWHHGVLKDDLFLQAMADLDEPVSPVPDETWKPGVNSQNEVGVTR
jgi:transketolase